MNNQLIGSKYVVFKSLSWKERFKAALVLVAAIFLLSFLFELLGLSWLFESKASGEANSWIGEASLFIFSLFTLAPLLTLIEELLFRYLPYKISAINKHKYFWYIGTTSAVVFAWGHSLTGVKEFTGLPIPQLIAGIYLWRFIPSGYKNVFWIHYIFNVLVGVIAQVIVLLKI